MNCPKEIAEIVLKILSVGILRCRALAWGKDFQRCAIEADHIHNLPDLLGAYRPDLLQFYWEIERASYVDATLPGDREQFESLWQKLESMIPVSAAKG